jgi:SAM-dependent methyltransferase
MGRVTIELQRRGIDVVGVDLDEDLLAYARRSAPSVEWVHADLATMDLRRRFDVVAMPGNVMVFCRPSDRESIISNAALHLEPRGRLVAGFELRRGPDELTLQEYDHLCSAHGFSLERRCSSWDGAQYRDEMYAVSVHRLRTSGYEATVLR